MAEQTASSTHEALRAQALHRIKQRRALRTHVAVYVAVNALVWGIWLVAGLSSHGWYPWPAWISLGWGVGLAFHAWGVLVRRSISEDEIGAEMELIAGGR